MRPEEPRSFTELKEVRLEDEDEIAFWTAHLKADPAEIAEAMAKVGCNRTAVELFLGVAGPATAAPESSRDQTAGR